MPSSPTPSRWASGPKNRRIDHRLISNKGTQCPIEFWPSAYAQRISGYSAAPSMGPSLVSQIWGLIAEELESAQRQSLGWVARARRTRHGPMGSDAQLRLGNFGPMPTPGIDVLKHQIALWDITYLCWNLTNGTKEPAP